MRGKLAYLIKVDAAKKDTATSERCIEASQNGYELIDIRKSVPALIAAANPHLAIVEPSIESY